MNIENDYKIAYFGKFPQTHISDSSLISKLNSLSKTKSNGYYEYDGNEYTKIKASPYDYYDKHSDKYSDNTKVINETAWFKVEPIKWRVLSNNNHKLTLVSEYILQAVAFDDKEDYSNDYYNSSIREWLNNEFYNISFTEEEKEMIIGNDEVDDDSVWLLSLEDVINTKYGFNNDKDQGDENRIAKPTDYALATGAYLDTEDLDLGGEWWLRTSDPFCSNIEYSVGSVGIYSDNFVIDAFPCARPSIIIEIE